MLIVPHSDLRLYGLTAVQTWFYFASYPKDPLRSKLLVSTLCLLDTIHTVLTSYTTYFYLVRPINYFEVTRFDISGLHNTKMQVTHYYSPSSLLFIHWSVLTSPFLPSSEILKYSFVDFPSRSIPVSVMVSNTIEIIVQSYFLHKIIILSRGTLLWRALASLIGILVVAHLGAAVEITILTFTAKTFAKLPQSKYYSAIPLAVTNICVNVLINGSLVYLLRGHRSGIRRTDNVVKRLIIYAAHRCLLISCLEIVEIIVFSSLTHTLWYLGIDFVMAKLYCNSLLVSLNNRLGGVTNIPGRDAKSATSIRFSVLAPRTNSTGIDIENSAVPSAQDEAMTQKTEKCVL
ncbi:hypothetical protein D9613_009330 [Agrocybe pediades]|uniref:DUF6534 domain-containing protein n=1 Tax=Agrocybe pediades TaxID=84607 RepID=A0A8H4VTZ9_9AGAR|nr:hypothetical protein D9613_009330 [Agrocybe pediades]